MHRCEWIFQWIKPQELRAQWENHLLVTEYINSGNETRRLCITHERRWCVHDTTELQCVYNVHEARDVRTRKAHDKCTALLTLVEAGRMGKGQAHRSVGRTREKMDRPGTRMVQGEQGRTEILAMRGEEIRLTAHEKWAMRMLSSGDGCSLVELNEDQC